MDAVTDITKQSSYEEVVAAVDAAAQDVVEDLGDEVNPDDVWHDLAISMLPDADRAVAREVGRCQLGWGEVEFRQFLR